MRIAVMGTGAVGGYFGAKLASVGHELIFIARDSNLAALKHDGLRIDSFQGNLHISKALFTDNPAVATAVDLVLFCVKSYDTDLAAQALTPLIGQTTRVLSLQNGVDNASRIAQIWGATQVLAGVVYIGAQLVQPATIKHSSGGKIVLGELDGGVHEPTRTIERALSAASIPCEITVEIAKAQWRKLLWNAPFCAISCLTRATAREIVESSSLRKLAIDCMLEVIAAAKTQALDLAPEWVDETLKFSESLGDFKPSMLQDLEAGKPLEFEAFNGVVVKLLRKAGQEAPTNQVFYGALSYIDKRIRAANKPGITT
ncbi:MAG TPA: ketopantoate reductase family protein [Candidatus Binatia bacterium]